MPVKLPSRNDISSARAWLKNIGLIDPKDGVKIINALLKMGAIGGVSIGSGDTTLNLTAERMAILRRIKSALLWLARPSP